MTEKSYFWTCEPFGDGGANSFSQKGVMTFLGLLGHTYTPETTGVIPWKEPNTSIMESLGFGAIAPVDELTPSYSSGVLTIGSGIAITGGIFYVNTLPVDFDITTEKSGYASAVDRIVLRRRIGDQTARLEYIKSTGAGLTAPLVNNTVYWDIPIVRIVLSGAGAYSSFIDDRAFASSPSANRVLINRRVLATNENSWVYSVSPLYANIELEITGGTVSTIAPAPAEFTPLQIGVNGIATNTYEILETYYSTASGLFTTSYATLKPYWQVRLPLARAIASGTGIDNEFSLKARFQNPKYPGGDALTPRTVGGEVFTTKAYLARGLRATLSNSGSTERISTLNIAIGNLFGGNVAYIAAGSIISLYGIK